LPHRIGADVDPIDLTPDPHDDVTIDPLGPELHYDTAAMDDDASLVEDGVAEPDQVRFGYTFETDRVSQDGNDVKATPTGYIDSVTKESVDIYDTYKKP
jgi:hypothetical protein